MAARQIDQDKALTAALVTAKLKYKDMSALHGRLCCSHTTIAHLGISYSEVQSAATLTQDQALAASAFFPLFFSLTCEFFSFCPLSADSSASGKHAP